ncbi:CHAT domain-containing protein [Martelella lutilitoris]|uniref:CHAT domain-containing protein n=1 Tax=Martelella lutilitoris TaxID=2583532 RepID=A0A5C4JNN4_9HYPH|nr:CHAT domain-containing protein [Martelella lutilitoris]TNB46900.1 CHAT domain-containing protein [Martelella lutilitoris]
MSPGRQLPFAALLLALLLSVVPARGQEGATSFQALFQQFSTLFQGGDYDAAASVMEQAIAVYDRNPGNPIKRASLAYYLALAYVNAGDANAALNTTQAAFAYRPELVSRYPEFYFVEGWAKARLGFIAQAAASYSAGVGLAEAYNEGEPGRFAPETLAAMRVQEAYLWARSSTVPSARLTIDPLSAAISNHEALTGAENSHDRYLLAQALSAQGFEIEARAAFLDLITAAAEPFRTRALARLAVLEWTLDAREAAAGTARAALDNAEHLDEARAAVMRSLLIVATAEGLSEADVDALMEQMAVIADKGAALTYEDAVDLLEIVSIMVSTVDEPALDDPAAGGFVETTLATLDEIDDLFISDSFARHKLADTRLKLARAAETLGMMDRARTLYQDVYYSTAASLLETAAAASGLARLGVSVEGELRDDLDLQLTFSETAAGAAEAFLSGIPARSEGLQQQQIARLSEIMEQAVDLGFDLLEARTIIGPMDASNVDEAFNQTGPYVFPFEDALAKGYAASAGEGYYADILDDAFRQIQLSRQSSAGRAIAAMTARMSAGSDELALLLRQRDALIAERNRILERAGEETITRYDLLADIEPRLDAVEAELDAAYPDYGNYVASRPLSLEVARGLLRADEALVTYLLTGRGLHIFAVTRENVIWDRTVLDDGWLEQTVRKLRATLDPRGPLRAPVRGAMTPFDLGSGPAETPEGGFDLALSHALYEKALGPVHALLPEGATLLIAPDGPLQAIPFAAMVAEAPDESVTGPARFAEAHWAIRDNAFATLPLPSTLRALRAENASRPVGGFLGIGNPHFRQDPAWLRLAPLPETGVELETLNAIVADDSGTLLLGDAANEDALARTALEDAAIIAFATHGLMGGEANGLTEPALALTPLDNQVAGMAGMRDGLLTASEIAALELDADWVLLSACNTAQGQGGEGSEGLSGLARAFFYAGARRLVVSHWAVQSDATVALTTGMFDALADMPDNDSGARALRRSILAMIDDPENPSWSHPGVWAPFVTVGW